MAPARLPRALRAPNRSNPRTTRTRPARNYAEPSDDDIDSDSDGSVEFEEPHPLPPARTSSRRSTNTNTRTPPKKRHRSTHNHASRNHLRSNKKHKSANTARPASPFAPIETSGVIPPWPTLPYHILIEIFRFASYPLYDAQFQPLLSGRWLLGVARLCRAFAEPAFTVLYNTPPLVPMRQAHDLVNLLMTNPKEMAFKYRQKVESLHVEVDQVAAYTLTGRGHLDLYGLIKDLPRLADLEFYHFKDMSPYRNLDDTIKWTYPEGIFDALEYIDPDADPGCGDKTSICKLRSWRWSSRLAGKKWPIKVLPSIHLKPSFASLRKIAFVNYQIPKIKKDEEDPKHEDILALAISTLTNLTHLVFESSTLANGKLLPKLPKNLRNIELINCWEIVADDFAGFLLTHGSQLRCLTLNHNQSLNLGFLPILGEACPRLQIFRMNLTYFNMHSFYHDSDPLYAQLLSANEVPIWPSTLQTIELTQMRKWEMDSAEMFFQSLLDSASDLPDLRNLSIQAILNIPWRDRASFRDKWIGTLQRVFVRKSAPPQTIVSLEKPTEVKDSKVEMQESKVEAQIAEEPSARSPVASRIRGPLVWSTSMNSNSPLEVQPPDNEEELRNQDGPSSRRSTRTSVTVPSEGKYAESSESSEAEAEVSAREIAHRKTVARELKILQITAGYDHPSVSPPQTWSDTVRGHSDVDSDTPLPTLLAKKKNKAKGKEAKKAEVIQGMCDMVSIRIDNLRPSENQYTMDHFIDSERSGDEEWNSDDDVDEAIAF